MPYYRVMVSLIAAIGKNRVLGRNNELLWHIPDDLRRFKALTLGHPVIMGRKTFESIGKPLPGRPNIVVSRESTPLLEAIREHNFFVVNSPEAALAKAKELDEEIFVIGGAQIYEQMLPVAGRLYLTLINDERLGDAYFPAYEPLFKNVVAEEEREYNGLKYRWVDLEK